jgi:hypothetical protein
MSTTCSPKKRELPLRRIYPHMIASQLVLSEQAPCVAVRVPKAAAVIDVSPATGWNMVNKNEVAHFRDNGITRVVVDWIGEPPPREGRAPSLREYVVERVAATAATPKRAMPEGVHRGRPRLRQLDPAAE